MHMSKHPSSRVKLKVTVNVWTGEFADTYRFGVRCAGYRFLCSDMLRLRFFDIYRHVCICGLLLKCYVLVDSTQFKIRVRAT